MRKVFTIGCLFLIALSCKAQIVPLEQKESFIHANHGTPEGTYFKDTNHLFDKYVGTWKGTYNNKEYTFYITKHTTAKETYLKSTEDEILVRYLITNPDGSIVEDTRNLPDNDGLVMTGKKFGPKFDYYNMSYDGRESLCGQNGTLTLRPKEGNQMILYIIQQGEYLGGTWLADCPQGRVASPFPHISKGLIRLTKQ